MKRIFIALIVVFSNVAFVNAQDTEKEEIDAMQAIFGIEKKQLINDLIKLTPEQSGKFWPVYDKYEVERKELGKERVALIKSMAEAFQNMTPGKADSVAMQSIKQTNNMDKLIEKYYGQMKKSVGSEIAFEFYQAEIYILSAVRSAILEQIPMYSNVKRQK